MPSTPPEEVTTLLLDARRGRREALDELFPLVYDELRRRAHAYLRDERTEHTLSTTALVHEAYLQLVDIERVDFHDRTHFLAVAATAMRQVLLDYAKRQRAAKREGSWRPVPLDEVEATLREGGDVSEARSEAIIAVEESLRRLEQHDPVQGRVVECRFYGGMTIEDTAKALGVSPATVKRRWAMAQAWLYRDLKRMREGTA